MAVALEGKKKDPGWRLGLAILVVSGIGFFLFMDKTPSTPDPTPLEGSVRFSGTQFVISNQSAVDWHGCLIKVNDDYSYKAGIIAARSDFQLGALNLTDKSGRRFDPVTFAPKELWMFCDNAPNRFMGAKWE